MLIIENMTIKITKNLGEQLPPRLGYIKMDSSLHISNLTARQREDQDCSASGFV